MLRRGSDRLHIGGKNTRYISYGGMVAVLSIMAMYATSIFRFNKLALLFAASLLICILVIDSDLKTAIASYTATSLLALIILPDKGVAAAYLILFGNYPLVKLLIERTGNIAAELVLKLLYFNAVLASAYLLSTTILPVGYVEIPLWGLVIAAELLFGAYDFLLSLAIQNYITFRKRNRK